MTIKKVTVGRTKASKGDIVDSVNQIYDLSLLKKDHNEADAIAIGHTYFKEKS